MLSFSHESWLKMAYYLIAGFALLFLGLTFKGSVKLIAMSDGEIKSHDQTFSITEKDKKVEISDFQIKCIKSDESIKNLSGLNINYKSKNKLKTWLAMNLKNSEIEFDLISNLNNKN